MVLTIKKRVIVAGQEGVRFFNSSYKNALLLIEQLMLVFLLWKYVNKNKII